MIRYADLTTPLLPHQQRVVDRMRDPEQEGLVIHHGLGSGKTLTSIAVADALGKPTTVVLPAALRANYEKEVLKHTNAPPPIALQGVEALARSKEPIKTHLLTVDEAHRLRNQSESNKLITQADAKKRLLLTGSPVYNSPADIAAMVNLASGKQVLPEGAGFMDRYFQTKKEYASFLDRIRDNYKETVDLNPATKAELQKHLQHYVDYHPSSKENFPTVKEETVPVELTEHQKDIYGAIMDTLPPWVRERMIHNAPPSRQEAMRMNSFLTAARQAVNTSAPFETQQGAIAHQAKIDAAAKNLKAHLDANPNSKALIYSQFLASGVNPYKAHLEALKVPYGEFTGEMPRAVRDQLIRDYNDNKIRALLVSGAGAEGLDLKGTRLVQVLEPHWNEERIKQVIGRGARYMSHAHLPENERDLTVQRYLAKLPRTGFLEKTHIADPYQSVDEYLYNLSKQKDALNQKIVDLYRTNGQPPGVPNAPL